MEDAPLQFNVGNTEDTFQAEHKDDYLHAEPQAETSELCEQLQR